MKKKLLLYLCILIFGAAGVYLTFIVGDTNKYDSQTKAYRIDPNEKYNGDSTLYYPIYYFKVGEKDYECRSKSGSSFSPKKSKNTVYYDSKNPEKCITQYEKSSSKIGGIILLVVTVLIIVLTIKKPTSNTQQYERAPKLDKRTQHEIEENAEKIAEIADKIQLIIKRVALAGIIGVLLVFIIIDTLIVKQTIKAKDYIETTAILENKLDSEESDVFDDYIYTFKDKSGNDQKITISIPKDRNPENELKIKYDENNPQEYYEEGGTYNKSDIIWYVVKIIAMILLIVLFFNKKLLRKISITTRRN